MTWRLPFSQSGSFAELFNRMDAKKEEVGIQEYGVSVTKLEDVFMKVSSLKDVQGDGLGKDPVQQGKTAVQQTSGVERRNSINDVMLAEAHVSDRSLRPACCGQFAAGMPPWLMVTHRTTQNVESQNRHGCTLAPSTPQRPLKIASARVRERAHIRASSAGVCARVFESVVRTGVGKCDCSMAQ